MLGVVVIWRVVVIGWGRWLRVVGGGGYWVVVGVGGGGGWW